MMESFYNGGMPSAERATQKTRPKEGDPIDIPIPSRDDVFADLKKTARSKLKVRRARRKRAK